MARLNDARRIMLTLPSVAAVAVFVAGLTWNVAALTISGKSAGEDQKEQITTLRLEMARQQSDQASQVSSIRLEQAKLQSDVRDILTRMEGQSKSYDAAMSQMSATVLDLKRQTELLRLQYDQRDRK